MGVGKIFSRSGQIMIFSKDFSRGLNVVKIRLSHSKLRKQLFLRKFYRKMSNFKIQGALAPIPPLPTPMLSTLVCWSLSQDRSNAHASSNLHFLHYALIARRLHSKHPVSWLRILSSADCALNFSIRPWKWFAASIYWKRQAIFNTPLVGIKNIRKRLVFL